MNFFFVDLTTALKHVFYKRKEKKWHYMPFFKCFQIQKHLNRGTVGFINCLRTKAFKIHLIFQRIKQMFLGKKKKKQLNYSDFPNIQRTFQNNIMKMISKQPPLFSFQNLFSLLSCFIYHSSQRFAAFFCNQPKISLHTCLSVN